MILRNIWGNGPDRGEKILIDRTETETVALGYVSVDNGKSTHTGLHDDEEEIYVILKGRARLVIGDEMQEVGPGDVAYVPRNYKHYMTCISDEKLEYLYFANWPDDLPPAR
jgi:oxalate decarboxylase/phosphoglucose isomerase-like protein (cupin superfamily)